MRERALRQRLKYLGKSNRGLAQLLGIPDARITEILNGKREIQVTELPRIAAYLEWTLPQLLNSIGISNPDGSSPVGYLKGVVQAGHWMESAYWSEDRWVAQELPIPAQFKGMDPFWLRVAGDSMDEVFPDGTMILCVGTSALDREPKSGERVIVERVDASGHTEVTVKEYREDGPRKWLVARSTKPEFAGAIELATTTTERVQVAALVVAHFSIDAV